MKKRTSRSSSQLSSRNHHLRLLWILKLQGSGLKQDLEFEGFRDLGFEVEGVGFGYSRDLID